MTKFVTGQYVELYPSIPSSRGGSVESGTRGVVRDVQVDGDEALYRVPGSTRTTCSRREPGKQLDPD